MTALDYLYEKNTETWVVHRSDGHPVGLMWLTERGCCYDHWRKDIKLTDAEKACMLEKMHEIERDSP